MDNFVAKEKPFSHHCFNFLGICHLFSKQQDSSSWSVETLKIYVNTIFVLPAGRGPALATVKTPCSVGMLMRLL